MAAGYSGTPLPKKLGIKPGHRVLLLSAPEGFELDLPEGVKVGRAARGKADVIVSFHTERADLARRHAEAARRDGAGRGAVDRVAEARLEGARPTSRRTWCASSRSPTCSWTTRSRRWTRKWSGLRLVIRLRDR